MISFRLQTRLTGKEEKVCLDNCLGCLLFRIFYVSHIYQLKRQFINIFKWFFSTRKQFPPFCFSISNLYESLFQYFFLCGSIVFIIPFLIYWFFLISRMCVCMCVCVCAASLIFMSIQYSVPLFEMAGKTGAICESVRSKDVSCWYDHIQLLLLSIAKTRKRQMTRQENERVHLPFYKSQ